MLRVTEIIKPLYGATFDDIPRHILEPAIEFGNAGHAEIEAYLKGECGVDNSNILFMLKQAADKIGFDSSTAHIEERLYYGERFTGQPDYFDNRIIADWKFTSQGLRNETALQLVAYDELIDNSKIRDKFAFQFNKDTSLSVYKLNDNAYADLHGLFLCLLNNHEVINNEQFELYEAIEEWNRIQYEYELFEFVDVFYPPLTVTSQELAEKATCLFVRLKEIGKEEERLKAELKRWMDKAGIESIEVPGYRLKLQYSKRPQYKMPKEVKEQYRVGTKESVSLVVMKDD